MRRASGAAANCDSALSIPVQKKIEPATVIDSSKRWNSQSASSDCTARPPANESRLNSAASLKTVRRDCLSGCGAVSGVMSVDDRIPVYMSVLAMPSMP